MSVDSWTLQVKSLEQVTQSVTISSSASVLQLKDAIQPVFDVASNRQRLIFQGKVLKDGKQLTEYANLQDGKVIHMVSRPADAPSNAMNDEPQTNTPRGTSPQMFPGIFGPSEGYTLITVDANISDLGGNRPQALASLLSGLFGGGGQDRNNLTNGRTLFGAHGRSPLGLSQNTRTAAGNIGSRTRILPTRDIGRNRRQSGDFSSLLDTSRPYTGPPSALEIRWTRVLAAIGNIQAILEAPPSATDATPLTWTSMSNTTPEQAQAIRSRLRENRSSGMAQTGLAVDRLADLMEVLIPRLRQLAQDLQADPRPHGELMPELRRMITVIRSLSMVNHAMGNIMTSPDDPSRRPGGLRPSPLGRMGRGTSTTSSNTSDPVSATINARRRQQPSARNQPNNANSNATANTTTTTTTTDTTTTTTTTDTTATTTTDTTITTSPNKRKSKSSTADSISPSSSSSSSPSSTCVATKRQKTSNDKTDTNKEHVDSSAPSITAKKGKINSQPKTNDN